MVQFVSPVQLTTGEPSIGVAPEEPAIASCTTCATASLLTVNDAGAEYGRDDSAEDLRNAWQAATPAQPRARQITTAMRKLRTEFCSIGQCIRLVVGLDNDH